MESAAHEIISSPVKVVAVGSAADGRWRPGSDVDIVIFANRSVPLEEKEQLVSSYWELNARFGLGLENAPLEHPIVFIAYGTWRRALITRFLFSGKDGAIQARKILKRVAPRQGRIPRRVLSILM